MHEEGLPLTKHPSHTFSGTILYAPTVPMSTTVQVEERPHKASYLLPGRIEGRPPQFLIDGVHYKPVILSHNDQLPDRVKRLSEESQAHVFGLMSRLYNSMALFGYQYGYSISGLKRSS